LKNKTLEYYEKNFDKLVDRYEKVNLDFIHRIILDNTKKDDFILELGFGSGREINFLIKNEYKNLYGIDGCNKFVEFVRKRFNSSNFKVSILPEININKKFDFIYSIAVIMHLSPSSYEKLTKNISDRLKSGGRVFISFSLGKRDDRERDFYEVDEKLLETIFRKYNIYKQKEIVIQDALNRNIKWKNILYKKLML
jgi:cyclopropane fatty-acyl-phospholipid synthase-like methyltransferase